MNTTSKPKAEGLTRQLLCKKLRTLKRSIKTNLKKLKKVEKKQHEL